MRRSKIPIVKNNVLTAGNVTMAVGSFAWFDWLAANKKFKWQGSEGHFLAYCEARRGKAIYWYAYRRQAGRLSKRYIGRTENVTADRLEQVSYALANPHRSQHVQGNTDSKTGTTIDRTILPKAKVTAPALPRKLLPRPRLTTQIDSPLTIVHAPIGFGKSTLISDWKRSCEFPVAWLFLDEQDNQPLRFWTFLVMALQTVYPDLAQRTIDTLRSSAMDVLNADAAALLTRDIERGPELGLILDDFQHIQNAHILDFLQLWLERLPRNLQLIITGNVKPPLALEKLRAKDMVKELKTDDLRFTAEEGAAYLLQYSKNLPLADEDVVELAGHNEGWAAGLVLTALALEKQTDLRQFVTNFSGAHHYFNDYFVEAVFQRLTPDIQSFLLKTSILKHLNGSLCDALTGQSNGETMLKRLWNENLFVVPVNESGWYRYHGLFLEMLNDQLKIRYPGDISTLHRRAAKWYRDKQAPADAIRHYLAAHAWKNAASLIEETALWELERYGEDSRLLRWLLELPESMVQRHKTLLYVYLQLASVALPQTHIENFISRIETSIGSKPAGIETRDESDVLAEIQKIRAAWKESNIFAHLPLPETEHETSWQLLNGLHLLNQPANGHEDELNNQIYQLYELAKANRNLFVILLAGGVYALRMAYKGKLKHSEHIAHQILTQAMDLRGSLPETASIALTTLSLIHFERYELALAESFLSRAEEVDPNPTSTNMVVLKALLRSKIQLAKGNGDDALVTIRDMRELHARRPSGVRDDLDLIAYEALLQARRGNIAEAVSVLEAVSRGSQRPLVAWARAFIIFQQEQFEELEELLSGLIKQYPSNIQNESTIEAEVMLAIVLFEQQKVNQSVKQMAKAVRTAAPEGVLRPFVGFGPLIRPVLAVMVQTEKMTAEAGHFIQETLQTVETIHKRIMPIADQKLADWCTAASITMREQDVLQLLGEGISNREIADRLCISESTVKTHLGSIYEKLGVSNRVQATLRANELALI